jgi:hypothetical protein
MGSVSLVCGTRGTVQRGEHHEFCFATDRQDPASVAGSLAEKGFGHIDGDPAATGAVRSLFDRDLELSDRCA